MTDYDEPKWLRIQVPSSLHKALKTLALQQDTTLQHIVLTTLANEVQARAGQKKGK